MKCAWESFINFLPIWMRDDVDNLGKNTMRELRLRINAPPELVFERTSKFLKRAVTQGDIQYCINTATKYSPWASETVRDGYISVPGGHRIGLCGTMIAGKQALSSFSSITSICIRISRDFPGIAKNAVVSGSLLILGKPGSGKTTFLRDLIRETAAKGRNRIAVVDEKCEIFPYICNTFCFSTGSNIDVLSGCDKKRGIEMLLRNMTPTTIAVDEITAQSDVNAIIQSVGCGVSLLATAHASGISELKSRPIYDSLLRHNIFKTLVILDTNMTWHMEYL